MPIATGLHLIDRTGGAGTLLLRGGNLPACSVAWAPDGKRIAAATSHGRLLVIDAGDTGEPSDRPHAQPLVRVVARREPAARHRRPTRAQSCPALWSVKPDGSGLRRIRGC